MHTHIRCRRHSVVTQYHKLTAAAAAYNSGNNNNFYFPDELFVPSSPLLCSPNYIHFRPEK